MPDRGCNQHWLEKEQKVLTGPISFVFLERIFRLQRVFLSGLDKETGCCERLLPKKTKLGDTHLPSPVPSLSPSQAGAFEK